jgi:Kef-type K+ transport system membrane component KefB
VVHWLVDAAVAFLAVLLLALIAGIPLVSVAIGALVVGLAVAPLTRRAEIRALAARGHAHDER